MSLVLVTLLSADASGNNYNGWTWMSLPQGSTNWTPNLAANNYGNSEGWPVGMNRLGTSLFYNGDNQHRMRDERKGQGKICQTVYLHS